MPWSNQSGGGGRSGGPWGGGGSGGPWGGGGGNNGPWGGGQKPGGGGGSGGQSPDLEELLRRSQDRIKRIFPGDGRGGGGGGRSVGIKGAGVAIVAVVAIWLATGFYRVNPGEVGVELVLGGYAGMTQPGLNYNWPYPIGEVYTPDVLRIRELNVGIRDVGGASTAGRDVPEESLMLTGDENIVDVDFRVQWRISNAEDYLFNIQNPEGTVKAVAESAMREVVGTKNIQPILTQERQQVEMQVQELMQSTLDQYEAGIEVAQVQLQKVDPPQQVIDAFRDVQAARADQERLQNEANAYANRVVPEARGEAAQVVQQANAYKDRVVAEARGQADRFVSIYDEYALAPDVTRQRLYLETLERVLGRTDKVIIGDDAAGGQGVVPYLPLDQIQSGRTTSSRTTSQTSGGQ
ncbi:FtsH protease activity modulator HflK [Amorphus orientalis]|uniref:Protein HflK n=1 Tax=Amorphus orientalis TaxID=649198 RepID=A0AAE3VND0_9HYPH|nr:FtsH protease activity modulator HflK [Amorphus orientalis]MDQ0315289.1 membrane protease subunit HflK [Amorphus orientalis]